MQGPFAADRQILASALHGFRSVIRPPEPTAFTYVSESYWPMAVAVLTAGPIPDIIVRQLIVPAEFWFWNLSIDALSLWSLLWIAGIYGATVPLHAIRSVQPVQRWNDAAELRRRYPGAALLRSGTTPMVRIVCAPKAIAVARYPLYRTRLYDEVLVATDRPRDLVNALSGAMKGKGGT